MKLLCIGLVVKGGKQFIDQWLESATRLTDIIIVVDNGADLEVREKLLACDKVKHYILQRDVERNMSRDYQKILDVAREEDCLWIWNLDIDEYVPPFDYRELYQYLINTTDESVGFPLLEMRGDNTHYVMVKDCTPILKHARLVHKLYKVLSHFAFNTKDKHGISIPHNCNSKGKPFNHIIFHFGHLTKELREEKRKQYQSLTDKKDLHELEQSWFEEDESKITIREVGDWNK